MQIKNSFDKDTFIKIGKGALIAGAGALVYYILTAMLALDYGIYTPIMVAVLSILVNAIKEYKTGK